MKTLKFVSAYQDHVDVPDVPHAGRPTHTACDCGAKGGWHSGDQFDVTDAQAEILLRAPGFSEVSAPKLPAVQPVVEVK